MSEQENLKWGKDIEFFLLYLGVSIGYGCLWRFPYMIYANGGGVFLIPFIIM